VSGQPQKRIKETQSGRRQMEKIKGIFKILKI
jgi:hypothetical protein